MQLPRIKIKAAKQLLDVNKEIQKLQAKIKQLKKNGSRTINEEQNLETLKRKQQDLNIELHREKIIKALQEELQKKIKVVKAKSRKCEQQVAKETDPNTHKMFVTNLEIFKMKLNFLNEFLNNVNTSPKDRFQFPMTEESVSSLMDSQTQAELPQLESKIRSKMKQSILTSQHVKEQIGATKPSKEPQNTKPKDEEPTQTQHTIPANENNNATQDQNSSDTSPMDTTQEQQQDDEVYHEEDDVEEEHSMDSEPAKNPKSQNKKMQMKRKWESMLGPNHPSWSAKRNQKVKESQAIFTGKRQKFS